MTLAADTAVPLPLLIQAQQRLEEATAQERAIRRGIEAKPPTHTWEQYHAAQQETRKAQDALDQMGLGLTRSVAAYPELCRAARQAASELEAMRTMHRQREARQQQRALQSEQQRDELAAHIVRLGGPDALPVEGS